MAGDVSRQNGVHGGRPKGRKNNKTLAAEARLERIRQKIMAEADPMTDAQIRSACGVSHFFLRNDAGQFVEITDPHAILTALNAGDEGKYYWIHTQNPNTAAYKELMDRTFGRNPERVEITGKDGGPLEFRVNKPW